MKELYIYKYQYPLGEFKLLSLHKPIESPRLELLLTVKMDADGRVMCYPIGWQNNEFNPEDKIYTFDVANIKGSGIWINDSISDKQTED
jgi:hypothetical protein